MPGERTEQATQHHREEARKQGDILHSRELSAAAGTLAGVVMLGFLGRRLLLLWNATFARFLQLGSAGNWEPQSVSMLFHVMQQTALAFLSPIALVMVCVAGSALCTGVLQTGGISLSAGSLGFKANRISPVSNARNLFTLRAAARFLKSLVPVCALVAIATQRMIKQLKAPALSTSRLQSLGSEIYFLTLVAAWLLVGWSLIDYFLEWQSREARLKMSRDDLREEMKQTEGNPQIRGRIRRLQRQTRRRRVQADVAKAAVVLTNPTHYAVALGFDFTTMETPTLLAKGRNLLAEEIKSEARSSGVPIVEDPPLARSLYRSLEIGQPIPVDLYAAVAAILAYLYRQRVEAELRERRAREAAAGEGREHPQNGPRPNPASAGGGKRHGGMQ
jgi:flagellar biosynthetic protein FlhB